MLKDRLRSSAILLTFVFLMVWLDARHALLGVGGIWLLPMLMLLTLGTAVDICRLLTGANRLVRQPVTVVATMLIPLFACIPYLWEISGNTYPADCPVGRVGWIGIGVFVAAGIALTAEMIHYGRGPVGAMDRLQAGIFVATYVGVPMAFLVAVRNLGSGNWGLAALLTLIAVTKVCDAGAYFAGSMIGKHKLIPRLSPGKTWEGACGGIVASIAVAYGCVHWLFPAMVEIPITAAPWWGPAVLGTICAITGMMGDLAESLVKRDTGAKDSGTTLPGLGGVWDVTDSLIATSVPGFLCFAAGLAGA